MVGRRIIVKIADLDESLYVRCGINEEWMLQIALGYDSGDPIPPIVLAADGIRVVDGRHRIAACKYLERETIEAIVDPTLVREEDILAAAFKANRRQSQNMTARDIEHTIELFLEKGVGVRKISGVLELNSAEAKEYIRKVKERIENQRVRIAIGAIRAGEMTVNNAAAQYDVPKHKLQEKMGSESRQAVGVDLAATRRKIASTYRSYSQTFSNGIDAAAELYEEGSLGKEQVLELMRFVRSQHRKAGTQLERAKARFEAKVASDEAAV